jgi:polyhydroxybutyrate depolymerase
MKLNYFFFPLFGFCFFLLSCNPDDPDPVIEKGLIEGEIEANGDMREYLLWVPENYDGITPLPLVIGFHGTNDDIDTIMKNSNSKNIADENGYFFLMPQALELEDGNIKFNIKFQSEPNDISFVNALLITLTANYKIDQSRIFAQGFSNGAAFTYYLACELPNKIAAIGAIASQMYDGVIIDCNPQKPIPVLQMQGDQDNYSWLQPTLEFWVENNNTDEVPLETMLPDIDTEDGSTVLHYLYTNGDAGCDVEHYKIINGGHQWPGLFGNMDIDASIELWNFFSKYDINGKIE